jgi:hypothetical protein
VKPGRVLPRPRLLAGWVLAVGGGLLQPQNKIACPSWSCAAQRLLAPWARCWQRAARASRYRAPPPPVTRSTSASSIHDRASTPSGNRRICKASSRGWRRSARYWSSLLTRSRSTRWSATPPPAHGWGPYTPNKSIVENKTAAQFASDFQAATGNQWLQGLGRQVPVRDEGGRPSLNEPSRLRLRWIRRIPDAYCRAPALLSMRRVTSRERTASLSGMFRCAGACWQASLCLLVLLVTWPDVAADLVDRRSYIVVKFCIAHRCTLCEQINCSWQRGHKAMEPGPPCGPGFRR